MLLNQDVTVGGHETVHAGYENGIYQILLLYKLKKATQRCDAVLVFCCPGFVNAMKGFLLLPILLLLLWLM